jgi:hypothetical protein
VADTEAIDSTNDPAPGADQSPFRIALIAVRSGSGAAVSGSASAYEGIVIGEYVTPGDSTVTQWRYRVFNLAALERLLALRRSGKPAPHPLDDLGRFGAPFDAMCYDQTGPDAAPLLNEAEQDDVLSANDLPDTLRTRLDEKVKVPDGGNGKLVSRMNFAVPLRDIVRIAFYDERNQPDTPQEQQASNGQTAQQGPGQVAEDGPLLVLDTCRFVDPNGDRTPSEPALVPKGTPFGSRVILFTDPMQTAAEGSIFALVVHAQVRLPLNGHATHDSEPRAMLRLYAVNSVSASRLFRADPAISHAGAGQANKPQRIDSIGPWFDSMRVGFTTQVYKENLPSSSRKWSKTIRGGWLGHLSAEDARARHPAKSAASGSGVPDVMYVPLLDKLGYGLASDSTAVRELGLRFVRRPLGGKGSYSLALRFEAGYGITKGFVPSFVPVNGAWPAQQYLNFAQEQPLASINWRLSPAATVRWVLTARPFERKQKEIAPAVFDIIGNRVASLDASLRQARDATPISLLPMLSAPDANTPLIWHFVGNLIDKAPFNRTIDPLTLQRTLEAGFGVLEPRFIADMWQGDASEPDLDGTFAKDDPVMTLTARAALPRLILASRSTMTYQALIGAPLYADAVTQERSQCTDWPCFQPASSELDAGDVAPGIMLGIQLVPEANDVAWARIGSLEIGFASQSAAQAAGVREAATRDDGAGMLRYLNLATPPDVIDSGIDAQLKLPVSQVRPAGQDDLPDDARITTDDRLGDALPDRGADADAPLLIPLDGTAREGCARWTLYAVETVTRHRNQTLGLSLKTLGARQADDGNASTATAKPADDANDDKPDGDTTPGDGKQDNALPPADALLVIDRAPFRVALVRAPSLSAAQTSEANEVAVWNAAGENGLSWRVVNDADTISLLLPPQVIGEAMEKNRNNDDQAPSDIWENSPVAARIGSATRLDLDPSYFDTRYAEPGWNLRRLMGYAGQRAPGVGLRDLRMEVMYGIVTRIRPSAPGLRLAEIGAVIGAPAAGVANSHPNVRAYVKDFNRLLLAERRRLAVDRLWKGEALDGLTIEQDVAFRLRTRHGKNGPSTPFRWPIPGGVPPDLDRRLADTFSASEDDNESFPGGVPWAFESANILRSVYARVDSGGGRIQGVHLSALGGWAHQRALWDQKKTAIDTETAMGRVHRYALERIGRVGALWNRAKHVIVYERSVVPSAQFYNLPPIGIRQNQLRGRPVLRKVEEYVELLEPLRRYPEKGNALEAAGCLTGAEFISRRIRVDSSWGGDVRTEGWQVPLWNKAFEQPSPSAGGGASRVPTNPDDPSFIYPKPQIRLIVMGEDNVEKALEIAEPEKLRFYTSVLPGETGDDTDAWHAVREVDFVDRPTPCSAKCTTASGELIDAMLPAEREHVPGYENLTIGLTPSKEAVSITHGRQDKGPVALLRNMTIGRSVSTGATSGAASQGSQLGEGLAQLAVNAQAQFDRVTGAMQAALGTLPALTDQPDIGKWRDAAKEKANAALDSIFRSDSLRDTWKGADGLLAMTSTGKPCDEIQNRLSAQFRMQIARGRQSVDDAIRQFSKNVTDPLQTAIAALDRASRADTLDQSALDALRNGVLGAHLAIRQAHDAAQVALSQISADLKSVVAEAGKLAQEAADALNGVVTTLRDALNALIAIIDGDLATAQRKAKDVANAARDARRQLDEQAARQGDAPAATRRLFVVAESFAQDVIELMTKFAAASGAVVDQLKTSIRTLDTNLSAFSTALEQRLRLATEAAKNTLDGITQPFVNLGIEAAKAEADAFDKVDAALDTFDGKAKAIVAGSAEAVAKAIKVAHDNAQEALTTLQTGLATLSGTIGAAEDRFEQAISPAVDQLIKSLTDGCKAIEGKMGELLAGAKAAFGQMADLENYKAQLKNRIETAIDSVTNQAADALAQLQNAVSGEVQQISQAIDSRVRRFTDSVQDSIRDTFGTDPQTAAENAQRIFQQGADTLRLFRALGDPPKADRLGFNRPEVAYVFQEASKIVDMTPALGLVNRVADTAAALGAAASSADKLLTSFGMRLPASAIGDQLVPDALKNLDVSKLFPDFSGIKLDGLFKNLPFPDLSDSNAVKVRHGFDSVELAAWLEADVDVPFSDPTPLLDFGPVQIMIDDARFTASARLSEGRAGTQRNMHGKLFGDWRLVCGGQTLVTFNQTGLLFDQTGKIDFNIQPDRVELAETLQFLTTLIEKTGEGGDFEIVPYMYGGVPAGVAARLDMVLPPLQTGVFGISDLSLHVLFGVSALPEFEIVTELGVGAKLAPFTLNVWILNGGGFLTSRLSFLPMARPSPVLAFTFEVGIVAGVGLGFSFGVISGGVWVQVGCSIALTWTTGPGGSTTAVSVFLLVRGCVDVLGLITVGINLLLQITYDGERMIASGVLTIKVKISMFYTVSASEHVEYTFLGEKKKEQQKASYSQSYA